MSESRPRQIVAIGGGGFSSSLDPSSFDRHLLSLSSRDRPKTCFVPTASADSATHIVNFYTAYSVLPCQPRHMTLFNPPTADLRSYVLDQDIIYVGGGNTKNLLALWREWGLDVIFREAWERGIILAGVSAGSICWFDEGITDSIPGPLTALKCLGFLKGSNCPHYDGESERRPAFHRLLSEGAVGNGYAADDGAALHYVGDALTRCISSRPNAKVYRLEKTGGAVTEVPMETRYLGGL